MQRAIQLNLFIITTLLVLSLEIPCLQKAKGAENTYPAIIASSKDAIVQTESGKVRGYIHTGTFTFKGIPYALAERFMPPQKPEPWEGARSSLTFGFVAPWSMGEPYDVIASRFALDNPDEGAFFFQRNIQIEKEDCQRLNIWSPGINDNGKRPVMVWLHGGGFSDGSGHQWVAFDGENLSKKGNIVVVTLNHRLNVLGFLDLSAFGSEYKYSGNVGIMDIVAALQWINKNIANFGGDPGNVTIFGQSGGGGKVSTLMAMPSAKGLFHKAIIQSGSTLKVSEIEISRKAGIGIMWQLGLKPYQVDELKKIPFTDLRKAGEMAWDKIREEIGAGEGFSAIRFGWSPTVDGDLLPAQPFDPSAPEISKDIPLLVGTTLNESLITPLAATLRNATQAQAEEYLKRIYGEKSAAFIEAFGEAYPGYKPVDLIDTDVRMRSMAIQQARLKAAQNGAPVYMYLFAWQTPVLDGIHKAFHCAEIPFAFNNIALTENMTTGSNEAYALADKVSQAWINFAKTGNPNHKGLPNWPAFTDEKRATMVFDDKCVVKENHDRKLLEIIEGN